MKPSDLKVYHVPFKTLVTGTISVLATSPEDAAERLDAKIEDGSLSWDDDNLCEEGVLHDGSVNFVSLGGGEIESSGNPVEQTNEKVEEHNDFDSFEFEDEEADENEKEAEQK